MAKQSETVNALVGCFFLFIILTVIVSFTGFVFKGCQQMDEERRCVTISGQVDSIDSWSTGYWAVLVTDHDRGNIPLTVAQANKLKKGDLVKVVAIFDGWGKLIEIRSIDKTDNAATEVK